MGREKHLLTPFGHEELEKARAYRQRARGFIAEQRAEVEKTAGPLLTAAGRAERTLKRQQGRAPSEEGLRALLKVVEPLRPVFTMREGDHVAEAERLLARFERQAAAQPEVTAPAEAETAQGDGQTAANAASPALAYLPEPAPIAFDEGAQGIIARLDAGEFDAPSLFGLNLRAQHLSLVEGFDALLGLQAIRNVAEYPFQIDTARQVLRRMRGRALLCDEVGLGKTIEAGLVLKELLLRGLARKVLILTPPSLVGQWQEEMADKFRIECITHDDPEFRALGGEAWGKFDRVIASISTAKLAAHSRHVLQHSYDVVIVDEAHHLKNRSSVSWKFVNDLRKRYLLLLTATPVQNNLDELFNLITLLQPGQLKTVRAFRQEFVQRGNPRMPRNQVKLRELMMDVMVRNTRSQVQIALPRRHAHTAQVKLHPDEAALYERVSSLVRARQGAGSGDRMVAQVLQAEAGSSALALAPTLEKMASSNRAQRAALREMAEQARAISSHAKGEALLTILRRHPEKVIVFTRFLETQRYLVRLLGVAGISTAPFSSGMPGAEKQAEMAAFADDRQVLVSTDVGSEGRNLQFCHTMVNYDLPWNPMRIEQRVGRIHRIGQTEEVHIYNLAGRDTIEDFILSVLDSKINMFEMVVGEIGVILGNLEEEREFDDLVLDIWLAAESATEARQGFEELGDRLAAAREEYRKAQEYDAALFGQEFAAEE